MEKMVKLRAVAAILIFLSGILIGYSAIIKRSDPQPCFTPYQNCIKLIVNAINQAKSSLLLQAWKFSSPSITRAVIVARQRGVSVKAILDRSQWIKLKHSGSRALVNNGIPLWIDYRPRVANNNVIIIDKRLVIVGSFKFSHDAQKKDAETLLIIDDKKLASQFIQNWELRRKISKRTFFLLRQRVNHLYQRDSKDRGGSFYKLFIQFKN